MKKILLLSLLSLALSANAQFYTSLGNSGGGGKIWLNFGGVSTFGKPIVGYGYGYEERNVKAETTEFKTEPAFMLVLEAHGKSSSAIDYGCSFTFQYSQYEWMGYFPGTTIDNANYNYRFGRKTKSLFIGMGIETEYSPVDRLVLSGGLGIGADLQFSRQHRAEAYRVTNGQLYNDPNVNNWHDVKDDMPFDIDFSVYGRVGVQYYITETLFAGVTAMYKKALASTSSKMDETTSHDLSVGYNYYIFDGHLSRLSYLLTLGFDM